MKKNIALLLIFFLGSFLPGSHISAKAPAESLFQSEIIPISYQGRFLPEENYASQWLYSLTRQSSLAVEPPLSPVDLLWQMHFSGHGFLDNTPLFWIGHKETKLLFGLNETDKRFSYRTLKNQLTLSDTNLPIIKKLILYHFVKAYRAPENRSGRTTLELSSLAPGLWVKWEGQALVILTSPPLFPWHRLTPSMAVAEGVNLTELENTGREKMIVEEAERIIAELLRFEKLTGSKLSSESTYEEAYLQLKQQRLPAKEIAIHLEQQFPLTSRLASAGDLFKALPGKYKSGEWYSLHALQIKVFNPNSGKLELVKNFTVYSDPIFEKIRTSYFSLQHAVKNKDEKGTVENKHLLKQHLAEGYQTISQQTYISALGKKLAYPSVLKLQAEAFYAQYPLTLFCIVGYAIALGLYFFALRFNRKSLVSLAFASMLVTFVLHTFLLALRCYILGRPPVANMFETMLYVPWVAVSIGLALRFFYSNPLPLIASALASLILLTLLQLNFHASSFENVQAVLDSQYWLLIHVLMVVGSYGLFLLGCLLGHIYLGGLAYTKQETPLLRMTAQILLKTLYIGVALLVGGTLLGGVWAAQSWGRFWDWDPKESWAFISICIYLLWIHAYRFGKIHHFGIAVGSILGFLAISFTWYGVNYILGTGLHSYGFGTGGTFYYYSYIFIELIFLAAMMQIHIFSKDQKMKIKGIDKKKPIC